MLPLQLQRLEAAVGSELVPGESAIIVQLRRELDEYFRGERSRVHGSRCTRRGRHSR
jgi:hypothetical protein